jgi:hypothetical protein
MSSAIATGQTLDVHPFANFARRCLLLSDQPMAPPAATTESTKSTGEAEVSAENGSSNEKNLSLTNSPLNKIEKVVVHPLVLLSVVDHFNRMGKIGNSQRVLGILLGSLKNKILDVSNSFARRTRRSSRDSSVDPHLVLP